jgi:ATP-dependent phosphoenolpyruvate carboxykinase
MSGVSERIMFPEKGWDSIEEYKSKVSHLMELFELHRAQL